MKHLYSRLIEAISRIILSRVTRIAVVSGSAGLVASVYAQHNVRLSLQDDATTLKVFSDDRDDEPGSSKKRYEEQQKRTRQALDDLTALTQEDDEWLNEWNEWLESTEEEEAKLNNQA